jgi:hypothetical protein
MSNDMIGKDARLKLSGRVIASGKWPIILPEGSPLHCV